MSINYHNIKEHPRNFRDVTGLIIRKFEKVIEKVCPEWEKVKKRKWKNIKIACVGRQNTLYNSVI
ncbi:hypothetical protein [Candidatus Mesenet endosymbiont of Agriotes lineatus]|uniref:hypothetical protein n=1 Tax=Candidatus Mesenet endosymbiont of Agriotes lineatus TaxID=3077948 RepID=UPI0030CA94F8